MTLWGGSSEDGSDGVRDTAATDYESSGLLIRRTPGSRPARPYLFEAMNEPVAECDPLDVCGECGWPWGIHDADRELGKGRRTCPSGNPGAAVALIERELADRDECPDCSAPPGVKHKDHCEVAHRLAQWKAALKP